MSGGRMNCLHPGTSSPRSSSSCVSSAPKAPNAVPTFTSEGERLQIRFLTWTLFILALVNARPAAALETRVVPASPGQGEIVTFFLSGIRDAREVDGKLGDRLLQFFRDGDQYAALAGIDVEAKSGKVP